MIVRGLEGLQEVVNLELGQRVCSVSAGSKKKGGAEGRDHIRNLRKSYRVKQPQS